MAGCGPSAEPPAPGTAPPEPSPELITSAYRARAEAEIRRQFLKSAHREIAPEELAEAMRTLDQRARDLPEEIARELGERELRNLEARADMETKGALGLLANLAGGGAGPLEELIATREAIERFFGSGGESPAATAASIALAAGVFELAHPLAAHDPFPSDVTISGAGIDATLIVATGAWSARGPIERLTLRDCTLHAGTAQLLDQESPASLRLERVRVVGFDRGASTAGIFRCRKGFALDARACRFEGGYGTVPGSGALFSLPNAALIARFEDCVFEQLSAGIGRLQRGVTLRFERCSFDLVLDDPALDADGRRGIDLVECRVTRFDLAGGRPAPRLLEALFPGWQQRLVR